MDEEDCPEMEVALKEIFFSLHLSYAVEQSSRDEIMHTS